MHRGVSRTLVRRAMRGVVPQSVLDSHRKIGLEVPEDKWVRGPLAELIQDVSASRNFQQRGLWRPGAVRRLIREHQTGRRAAGNLIWRIIGTELWLEMFIDSRPAIPRRAPRSRLAVPGRRL